MPSRWLATDKAASATRKVWIERLRFRTSKGFGEPEAEEAIIRVPLTHFAFDLLALSPWAFTLEVGTNFWVPKQRSPVWEHPFEGLRTDDEFTMSVTMRPDKPCRLGKLDSCDIP